MKLQMMAASLPLLLGAPTALAQAGNNTDPAVGDEAAGGMHAPKAEKEDKKEIEAFNKSWQEAWKKGDLDALTRMVDFPVRMVSDDANGTYRESEMSQESWVAMVKPRIERMQAKAEAGKESKMTPKVSCYVMSDNLASCEREHTPQAGPLKGMPIRSQAVLTRTIGGWKMKSMMEAGWSDSNMGPRASN